MAMWTAPVKRCQNKKLHRRLRKANFGTDRTVESFRFDVPGLSVNKAQVFDIATCLFIEELVNVLIVGPTGVGKSHLAQAIGHHACRRGYDVLFCHRRRSKPVLPPEKE